jgi:hypothetical protein
MAFEVGRTRMPGKIGFSLSLSWQATSLPLTERFSTDTMTFFPGRKFNGLEKRGCVGEISAHYGFARNITKPEYGI